MQLDSLSSLLCAAALCILSAGASAHECNADVECFSTVDLARPLDGQMVLKQPLISVDESPYQNISALIAFINSKLSFSTDITVRMDVEEGPLYDPATNEIWMPVVFGNVIASNFVSVEDTLEEQQRQKIVDDVVLHTLVHEAGHVLFAQESLPILAREEDSVDALASVLLLEYHERGDEIVLNAAEMFGLESDSVEWFEAADFWDEHSLDIQRYYTSICHVYGSDSEGNEELINEDYGLSEERAEICIEEYTLLREGWLGVLEPYLKE